MAVALDVVTDFTAGTGTLSATHTPVGTPRGAVVGVVVDGTTSDEVTTAAYGAASLTEVSGSPHTNAASPGCSIHIFFLGTSVPTGAQTVTVNVGGSTVKDAWCYTLTADDDTTVVDTTAVDGAGIGSHTGTLALGGVACHCAEFVWSNGNNTLRISPLTNWSVPVSETDFGSEVAGVYTYDIVGTADVTMGWTHDQADSGAALGIAIREGGGGGGAASVTVPGANQIVIQAQNPIVTAKQPASVSAPASAGLSLTVGLPSVTAAQGTLVTAPNASSLMLTVSPPGITAVGNAAVVVPGAGSLFIGILAPDIQASILGQTISGVSLGQGMSLGEGVTDYRYNVGGKGVVEESETPD